MRIKPTDALPPMSRPAAVRAAIPATASPAAMPAASAAVVLPNPGVTTALPLPSYEVVTPAIAREWLKFNIDNRPLKRAHVDALKRVFERGEYRITHQGIGFSISGRLLDGQHRLTALAEMPEGFSIVIAVTRGMAEDAFVVIDGHAKRSYSDSLRISKGLSEVARSLATLVAGPGAMSPQFLETYVDFVQPYYDALTKDLASNRRFWSTANVRTAAIIALVRGMPFDYVRETYRCLITADIGSMPPLVQTMFRAELNGKMKAMEKNETLARCAKMFNPAFANQTKAHFGEPAAYAAETREFFIELIPNARR